MFTIPEPTPSSWPETEPMAPIVTAGKVAPIPTPSSTSATPRRRGGSAGSVAGQNSPMAITSIAGIADYPRWHVADCRPTSGDTTIAMTATGRPPAPP